MYYLFKFVKKKMYYLFKEFYIIDLSQQEIMQEDFRDD